MENALTRRQALRAMTIWAAKSQFEENEKGSIEEGKFADFIVTRQDLMTMPAEGINTLPVDMTFVGGNWCIVSNPEILSNQDIRFIALGTERSHYLGSHRHEYLQNGEYN
jgi:hypothetical protein